MRYILFLCGCFVHLTGVGSSQSLYEAYEVKEYTRGSCDRGKCVVRGSIGTESVPSSQDSTKAQAAVYSLYENGTMQLLGISSVTPTPPTADFASVTFYWPGDAQSVVLLYIRRITSNRNITLVPSQLGRSTNRFHLEDPNMCRICRNSASVIRNSEVPGAANLNVASAATDSAVESTCSGVSPVPCPDPTPSSTESAPTIASTPDVSPSPSLPRITATPSPDNPGGTIHSPNVSTYTTTMISSILVPVIVVAIIIVVIVGIIVICKRTRSRDKIHSDLVHGKSSASDQEDRDRSIAELEDGKQSVMMNQNRDLSIAKLEDGKQSVMMNQNRDPSIAKLEDGKQSVMMTQNRDPSIAELEDGDSDK